MRKNDSVLHVVIVLASKLDFYGVSYSSGFWWIFSEMEHINTANTHKHNKYTSNKCIVSSLAYFSL